MERSARVIGRTNTAIERLAGRRSGTSEGVAPRSGAGVLAGGTPV